VSQLCVRDEERTATILAVSRKCAYTRSTPPFFRIQILISSLVRYYALSAASAMFKYVEIKLNTQFASASLRIRFVPVEGTVMIDPETVRNLEIVDNMGNARSPHSLFGYEIVSPVVQDSFSSFFFFPSSVLNHCSTAMARRLLRATLLAPVTGKSLHPSKPPLYF
jgi:DNA mismatch repair protein MSH4